MQTFVLASFFLSDLSDRNTSTNASLSLSLSLQPPQVAKEAGLVEKAKEKAAKIIEKDGWGFISEVSRVCLKICLFLLFPAFCIPLQVEIFFLLLTSASSSLLHQ